MGKEKSRDKGKTNNKKSLRIVGILVLCIIGIILNFEAGWIVTKTEAPLYMDTVGTVMVASIGGYIPSITVGFLTNILKSIYNPTSAYFAFLNVLIALIASYLARSGWLKKWYKLIAAGCILAITSGILSAIMSYYLYGFATEGTSAQLALSLFETVGLPKLLSEIIANCAMEFLDKMLTVVIVFIINIGLPETIRDNYLFDGWQQTPLSPETLKQIRSIKIGDNKLSLRTKILLILILSLLCISIAATGISYYLYRENMIEEHTYLAQSVANLAASLVDPERVDEYLSDGEAAPGYKDVEKKLYELRESSPDIEFIYIYQIKIDGCHVVFDLDAEGFPAAEPGEVLPIDDETFEGNVGSLIVGEEIDPVVTNDSYGYLMTVYKPIYNKEGKCVCYVGTDVSMKKLQHNTYIFFAKLISLFFGVFLVMVSIGMWLAEFNILIPVNTMTYTANVLIGKVRGGTDIISDVTDLDIHTGDEIESLYRVLSESSQRSRNVLQMFNSSIDGLMKSRSELVKSMADHIENRDHYTTGHVERISQYTKIILRSMEELGYYKETLTKDFIKDVIYASPLHDVGKSSIDQDILNKKGKLTDAEFKTVKMHTTAGGQEMDKILKKVPDSGFMKEAKNIALYHHEKWDGTGYPEGLKGEDIPLSARIVGAADVLDAILSERSYKKALSFEDALDVINDESGNHFDPLVAEAIIMAEDEIKKVRS